jgi:hypothetical protein
VPPRPQRRRRRRRRLRPVLRVEALRKRHVGSAWQRFYGIEDDRT